MDQDQADREYFQKRQQRNAARRASLQETAPFAVGPGATLDSQITTLQTQTSTLGTDLTTLTQRVSSVEQRVTALEAGTPPVIEKPVVTPGNYTIPADTALDAFICQVAATGAPTSYAIVSGNTGNCFTIYDTGNLRTSETVKVAANTTYNLGITATNSAGASAPATFKIVVQAADQPPVPGTKRWPDYDDPMCGVPAGTTLTTTGGTTISTAGAKISGKKYTGRVTISADNVELFNCEIVTDDWWGIDVKGRNANIHHCYIHSEAVKQNSGVNTSTGTRVAYCRFRGWENACNLTGSNVIWEWNDSCKLKGDPNASHYDNLQADGGSTNVQIRNNRHVCEFGWTSCCMIDNYFGKMDQIEIHDNYMEGGGYVCYIDASQNPSNSCTNVVYHHNTLKAGQWGYFYWKQAGAGCSHHDNVDQNGRAID